MAKIIHSTYEIIREIGSGGGGIVYLANHLNLNKKIVLKADKRKITTRPELLRREVDVMKNLSHTYIPQVYDFFIENDTVYTAIDYIEGESLDKPLKRGEKYPQPLVIKWARQLLEALSYLHAPTHGDPPKGYVHSDIKPANLMRTPNNDICLIDFNIALALGEVNLVGHSAGYASPEHYGIDYSSGGAEDTAQSGAVQEEEAGKRSKTVLEDADAVNRMKPIQQAANASDETVSLGETVSEDETVAISAVESSPETERGQITGRQSAHTERNVVNTAARGTKQQAAVSSSVSSRKRIMPDVRSDIYMVGATLYHLLSGTRPAKDAENVVPLSEDVFSPQLVHIISKAMNRNPDLRFQTAAEMLYALNHLHTSDARYIRHKRKKRITLSVFSATLAAGVLSAFVGLKRIQTTQLWKNDVSASNAAYENGNVDAAIKFALDAIPDRRGLLTPSPLPSAQLALTNALGVYDLSDGYKPLKAAELPSELLYLEISPDGDTAVCIYAFALAILNTANGAVIDTLPVMHSALAEAKYLDNDHIIYAGADGITKYCISAKTKEWCGKPATSIAVSGNGKTAAAIYRDASSAYIYDTENGNIMDSVEFEGQKQWITVNDVFANPNDNIFSMNGDGSLLAVSFSDGTVTLFDLSDENKPVNVMAPNDEYIHFEGGFYQHYFAFSASSKSNSAFAVLDTDTMTQTGGFRSDGAFSVFADERGIKVQTDHILVQIDPVTGEQEPLVTYSEPIWRYDSDGQHTVVASKGAFSFFDSIPLQMSGYSSSTRPDFVRISNGTAIIGSMDSPTVRILRYASHADSTLFRYDTSCDHLEARVSQNQDTLMLFQYSQFRLYDKQGAEIARVEIPSPEQVYDQQYIRKNGASYLEVIYNDGKIIDYDATNGEIMLEAQRDAPDAALYEEFETDSYKITCPLHGSPEVYSAKTGKLLSQLKEDAYCTYATEMDGQLIVQYVTADGYRYGQLLDSDLELIANLPYLCDILDNKLLFDYPSGAVCISPVYPFDQLLELAETQKGESKT